MEWIDHHPLLRVLLLWDYNTRVVLIGTTLLGLAAGLIGSFAYLRKRALMGDALSHATLPGVAVAFLVVGHKHLGALLLGATVFGILGVLSVLGIRQWTRIKEDAAIGIVLSVFFGAGVVLFSIIQQMGIGGESGLQAFIYGKAASMITRDARLIALTAAIVVAGCLLLFKEFRLVCFDAEFAAVQGLSILWIDLVMMGLVVLTTVIGLQAVGLILIIALLIIPASAARFWTDRLDVMTGLAALIGAISGWSGAAVSALTPRLPTGAVIVIVAGVLFAISMLVAPRRGIIASVVRRARLRRKVARQHLLRALAEIEESRGAEAIVPLAELRGMRSWTDRLLRQLVRKARDRDEVEVTPAGHVGLTPPGRKSARRVLRNHRLWEQYLIQFADIAPSHVDRDADEVEHVLPDHVITQLESRLSAEGRIPPSPHVEPEPT